MALPVTALYALLACASAGFWEKSMIAQFAILVVSSYMMLELNNANALIRIYSRMVSCSYLMFAVMADFLFVSLPHSVVQLCFIAFLLLLFRAYQDKRAVGMVFYAFAMIGVASMFFPQLLFFVPVAWVLLFTNIMAGSVRTYFASVLGLLMPYWFAVGYCLYIGRLSLVTSLIPELWQFGPVLDLAAIDGRRLMTAAIVLVVALTGIIHFHRTSYKDKIRTRLLFETFSTFFLLALLFMLLQPQHFDFLLGIMIVCASPHVGHFVALTNSRFTNAWFVCMLAGVLAMTFYNIWIL